MFGLYLQIFYKEKKKLMDSVWEVIEKSDKKYFLRLSKDLKHGQSQKN
jgi:hypothetical protein